MSNNKSLDGIKKLNKQDLKKAREVVLSFIGEKDKHKKAEVKTILDQAKKLSVSKPVRIDGIFSKSKKIKKTKMFSDGKTKQEMSIQENQSGASVPQEIALKKTEVPMSRQGGIRDPDSHVGKKAKLQLAELKKIKDEQARLKQQAISKKQIEREKKKLKKIKQLEEKGRMQEMAKVKRQLERKRKINEFKQNIIKLPDYLVKFFKLPCKIFGYIILILIIIIILGYCALSIALLNFHLDNNAVRIVSRYMPVPALITQIGIVEYYHYKDTESRNKNYYFNQVGLTPDKIELSKKTEEELVKELLVKELAQKYNLQIKDRKIKPQSLKERVADRIAFDQEINQFAFSRIMKIKSTAAKGEDFNQVARKYGDESSTGVYYSINDAAAKFGPSAVDLAVEQLSDIMITSTGYYLVECYGRRDNLLGLKYVFVKCKTLDQYLDEEIIKIKVWNLVD